MKSTPIIPNGREQKCREPRNLWPFSPVNGEIKLRLEYLRQNRRFKPGQIDITHLVCPPLPPDPPLAEPPPPTPGLAVSQTLHHPQSDCGMQQMREVAYSRMHRARGKPPSRQG